jgi:hypothetical protein
MRWSVLCGSFTAIAAVSLASAQPVPQPFPRPAGSQPAAAATPARDAGGMQPAGTPQANAAGRAVAPDEAMLGVPIYPNAQFIASYDAGRGQRYYLFGVANTFTEIVGYYRNVLKNRGDAVYDEPPVHMFETGRYREDSMAFPPSVTVKDYTWGGSQGYLVALPGGRSQRYPTIIQIVPASPADRP